MQCPRGALQCPRGASRSCSVHKSQLPFVWRLTRCIRRYIRRCQVAPFEHLTVASLERLLRSNGGLARTFASMLVSSASNLCAIVTICAPAIVLSHLVLGYDYCMICPYDAYNEMRCTRKRRKKSWALRLAIRSIRVTTPRPGVPTLRPFDCLCLCYVTCSASSPCSTPTARPYTILALQRAKSHDAGEN